MKEDHIMPREAEEKSVRIWVLLAVLTTGGVWANEPVEQVKVYADAPTPFRVSVWNLCGTVSKQNCQYRQTWAPGSTKISKPSL